MCFPGQLPQKYTVDGVDLVMVGEYVDTKLNAMVEMYGYREGDIVYRLLAVRSNWLGSCRYVLCSGEKYGYLLERIRDPRGAALPRSETIHELAFMLRFVPIFRKQ
jgi:hypothetical protein